MDPQKERPATLLAEPSQSAPHDFLAASLQTLVTIFLSYSPMKSCVINIKPTFETQRQFLWFEHERSDERRSAITVPMQEVGQERQIFAERIAHVVHVMKLRVRSGENRRMRWRGEGHLCVGAQKDKRLAGQRIQVRCKPTF